MTAADTVRSSPAAIDEGLDGRVALVTGSSRGIGEAIARGLAAAGVRVVVHSASSPDEGRALAAELPEATYHRADVADRRQAEGLVEAACATWGGLDIVVNCAGSGRRVPFEDLDGADDALWRRCFDVHVLGLWHVTTASVPALRLAGDGCVVNITSVAGSTTTGSSIPYAASKAGADHLTRLLAKALAPDIRVNAIAPGFIRTSLTDALPADYIASYERGIPLQHGGMPKDIADACLSIARTRFMTGTTVVVDGGLHIN